MRAIFGELHGLLETMPGPAAAALEARMWEELQASARRRSLLSQPL
jgi:hypothetical protein